MSVGRKVMSVCFSVVLVFFLSVLPVSSAEAEGCFFSKETEAAVAGICECYLNSYCLEGNTCEHDYVASDEVKKVMDN